MSFHPNTIHLSIQMFTHHIFQSCIHSSFHPFIASTHTPPNHSNTTQQAAHLFSPGQPLVSEATGHGSLAVQQVHDGLQHIVSILGHAAAGTGWHVARALHLAKDVAHLFDTLLNVRLEAGGIKRKSSDQTPGLWRKDWMRPSVVICGP